MSPILSNSGFHIFYLVFRMPSKLEILEMKEVFKGTGRHYGGKVNVVSTGFLDFPEVDVVFLFIFMLTMSIQDKASLNSSILKLPAVNRFSSTPERKLQSEFSSSKFPITSNIDYKLKHPSVFKTHPSASEVVSEVQKPKKSSIFCCCVK